VFGGGKSKQKIAKRITDHRTQLIDAVKDGEGRRAIDQKDALLPALSGEWRSRYPLTKGPTPVNEGGGGRGSGASSSGSPFGRVPRYP